MFGAEQTANLLLLLTQGQELHVTIDEVDQSPSRSSASAVTRTGSVSDVLLALVEGTGASRKVMLSFVPRHNIKTIQLLQKWIEEDGVAMSPDLNEEIRELEQFRFNLPSQ